MNFFVQFCFVFPFFCQFPPQYRGISEQHQPAELIPQFSTIEYTLTVSEYSYVVLDKLYIEAFDAHCTLDQDDNPSSYSGKSHFSGV